MMNSKKARRILAALLVLLVTVTYTQGNYSLGILKVVAEESTDETTTASNSDAEKQPETTTVEVTSESETTTGAQEVEETTKQEHPDSQETTTESEPAEETTTETQTEPETTTSIQLNVSLQVRSEFVYAGDSVELKTNVTGGSGEYTYYYYLYDGDVKKELSDAQGTANDVYTWIADTPGTKNFVVKVTDTENGQGTAYVDVQVCDLTISMDTKQNETSNVKYVKKDGNLTLAVQAEQTMIPEDADVTYRFGVASMDEPEEFELFTNQEGTVDFSDNSYVWTANQAGKYILRAEAEYTDVDGVKHVGVVTTQAEVLDTDSLVSVKNLTDGSWVNAENISQVEYRFAKLSDLYRIEDENGENVVSDIEEDSIVVKASDLTDGHHKLTLLFEDGVVDETIKTEVEIQVDTKNPELKQHEIVISKNQTMVTVETTDELSGVESVDLPSEQWKYNDTDNTIQVPVSEIAEGENSVNLIITDHAGNKVTEALIIKKDTKHPVVTMKLTDADGNSPDGWMNIKTIDNYKLVIEAVDEVIGNYASGIRSVQIKNVTDNSQLTVVAKDGKFRFEQEETKAAILEEKDGKITVTIPAGSPFLTEGNGKIAVSATDDMGNVCAEDAYVLSYSKDVTAPDGIIHTDEKTNDGLPESKAFESKAFDIKKEIKFFAHRYDVNATVEYDKAEIPSVQYELVYKDDVETFVKNIAQYEQWKTYTDKVSFVNGDAFAMIVKLTDKAGNVSYIATDGYEVDTEAPEIHFEKEESLVTEENPDNLKIGINTKYDIRFTLSDNFKGVDTETLKAEFKLEKEADTEYQEVPVSSEEQGGKTIYTVKTSDLKDGVLIVRISVSDKVGNEQTRIIHLIKDTAAPVILTNRSEYEELPWVNAQDITNDARKIRVDSIENRTVDEYASELTYHIVCKKTSGEDAGKEVYQDLALPLESKDYSISSWNLEDGEYEVQFTVEDLVGNVATDTIAFKKDTVAPAIQTSGYDAKAFEENSEKYHGWINTYNIQEPDDTRYTDICIDKIENTKKDDYHSNFVYSITSDVEGKFKSVENVAAEVSEEEHYVLSQSDLKDGEYNIVVTAEDEAGNEAEPVVIAVKKDTQIPVIRTGGYSYDGNRDNWINIQNAANSEIQIGAIEDQSKDSAQSDIKEYVITAKGIDDRGTSEVYGKVYKASRDLKDGSYDMVINATDKAGNRAEEVVIPVRKDTENPVITTEGYTYEKNGWINLSNVNQSASNILVKSIVDKNKDNEQSKMKSYTIESKGYRYESREYRAGGTYTLNNFEVNASRDLKDGVYTVVITAQDVAGNTVSKSVHVQKDTQLPSGRISIDIPGKQLVWENRAIESTMYAFSFTNRRDAYQIHVQDENKDDAASQVAKAEFIKSNIAVTNAANLPKDGWTQIEGTEWNRALVSADEDVLLYVRITDVAGNVKYISTDGVVFDFTAPNTDFTAPRVTVENRTIANGIASDSVVVRIHAVDPAAGNNVSSGLNHIDVTITNSDTGEVRNYGSYDVPVTDKKESLQREYTAEFTVDKETFNSNHVEVTAIAYDNAGNVSNTAILPISIDSTKPVVNVSYDNNDVANEKYFKADRTMTVRVTERNFDANNTRIYITKNGTESVLSPSEWTTANNRATTSNGDADVWTYTYTFHDNADYKVRIETTDLAGNVCETYNYTGAAPQEFTIDKILPVITANDAEGFRQENTSYTVTITEHNFNPSAAVVSVTRAYNGAVAEANIVRAVTWQSDGDVRTARVDFTEDGDYTFRVDYTDQAGNPAQTYQSHAFTVDKTDPILSDNLSAKNKNIANKGDLNFEFTYSDVNAADNAGMIQYSLKTISGKTVAWEPKIHNLRIDGLNSYRIVFSDKAEKTSLKDGIYELTVSVRDLSGRTVEETKRFSINRRGSAYDFEKDSYLAKINTKYINEVEDDIEILVMNCDEITDYQVVVYNGFNQKKILELNKDFEWMKDKEDEPFATDARESGYTVYTCKIHKSVFEENGSYKIEILTKDAADDSMYGENATLISNADAQDSENAVTLAFTVDNVAPEITLIGLKNNGKYDNDQNVQIDYADANPISSVVVTRKTTGGKVLFEKEYTTAEIESAGANKGVLEFVAKEYSGYQNVEVTVKDIAGNETTQRIRVLITSNVWVKFINNTAALVGTIIGIIVVIAGIILLTMRKKKESDTKTAV